MEPADRLRLVPGSPLTLSIHDAEAAHAEHTLQVGSPTEPAERLVVVERHAPPPAIHDAQRAQAFGVSQVGCLTVPANGFGVILWHAAAIPIQEAQFTHRRSVVLVGRPLEPLHRGSVVARDPSTLPIHGPQGGVTPGVARFGRATQREERFGIVARYPAPVAIHDAKQTHARRVALVRCATEPANRLRVITPHPLAAGVEEAERKLRGCIPLFGKRTPPPDRRREVVRIRREGSLELGKTLRAARMRGSEGPHEPTPGLLVQRRNERIYRSACDGVKEPLRIVVKEEEGARADAGLALVTLALFHRIDGSRLAGSMPGGDEVRSVRVPGPCAMQRQREILPEGLFRHVRREQGAGASAQWSHRSRIRRRGASSDHDEGHADEEPGRASPRTGGSSEQHHSQSAGGCLPAVELIRCAPIFTSASILRG